MRSFMRKFLRNKLGSILLLEDIKHLLRQAEKRGIVNEEAARFALAAISMTDDRVRDIMTPRSQVIYVNPENDLEHIINTILKSGFSRFPVIGKEDKVEGLILIKDLFPILKEKALTNKKLSVDEDYSKQLIKSLAQQDTLVVPESRKITGLLKEMRVKRKQAALVVDEYGVFSGLVSIEDILEQIVGEIEDEHDSKTKNISFSNNQKGFIVNAATEIEEINKRFQTNIHDDNFDTIGGMVVNRLGHLPKQGETLQEEHLSITVANANERQILEIFIKSSKKLQQAQRKND